MNSAASLLLRGTSRRAVSAPSYVRTAARRALSTTSNTPDHPASPFRQLSSSALAGKHEDDIVGSIERQVISEWGSGHSHGAPETGGTGGLFSIPQGPDSCHVSPMSERRARRRAFDLPDPAVGSPCVANETSPGGRWTPPLSKIVATIGPTSETADVLPFVVGEGMRIMRLNFSHATFEEAELRIKNLRKCQGRSSLLKRSGDQNLRAVLLDTRGPEIRTGKLAGDEDGKKSIEFEMGNRLTLHTSDAAAEAGSTARDLYIDYPNLAQTVRVGSKVLLDDGAVALTVTDVDTAAGTVECAIDNTAELRSRAGVNLPGCVTDLPPMSEKDKVDIRYGLSRDIDYIAASFVQDEEGVREIRAFCAHVLYEEMGMDASHPLPLIIAKIESVAALRNFEGILEAADGIMVARGDLGVEIPIQQVTNAQKEMVARCNAVGKPVIVATQMLESMAKNPRPTRAEVADVTNAIYDGADAVMTSGETAKGKYPVATIKMMNEIIRGAESFERDAPYLANIRRTDCSYFGVSQSTTAVCKAAVAAAEEQNAAAIIVMTTQGRIPRIVAAHRPHCPIVAFCPNYKVGRQLQIHRGVHPIVGSKGLEPHERPAAAVSDAKEMGVLRSGDNVVVVMADKSSVYTDQFISMRIATVS